MKVCVFGAGAVGSNLAARLVRAGRHEVSVVARGPHLQAIRDRGITLREGEREFSARPVAATAEAAELPPQDCVIVTLKAHSAPSVAGAIAGLLAPGGFVVFAVNGIPWWWRYRGSAGEGSTLPLLDPDGALWRLVRPERVLGCVIDSANEIVEPGVVLNKRNNNWTLGEPDGSDSPRLAAAVALFTAEGAMGLPVADIRFEVWCKLAMNICHSPVTALTLLGTNASSAEDGLRGVKRELMGELMAVARAHGADISARVDVERATQQIPGVGQGSRPSMLQDVLAARPIEAEALLGQPLTLAREAGVHTPVLDIVCTLIRGRDKALRVAAL